MQDKNIILIVNGSSDYRYLLSKAFCDRFTTVEAADREKVASFIEANAKRIAVILLRYLPQTTDAPSLLKWLSTGRYAGLPVIALSDDAADELSALRGGAWDFIAMPASSEVILARIDNLLARYGYIKEQASVKELEMANLKMDSLINSIPGGIAIYRLENGFKTIYFSDGVAQLSGYTREEYAQWIKNDAADAVYKGDRDRLYAGAIEALRGGETIDETYRIYHKDGSLVWVHLTGMPIGEEEGHIIVYAVFQSASRQSQLYNELLDQSNEGIYACDIATHELLYVNKKASELLHTPATPLIDKKCYSSLFNRTTPCSFCKIDKMTHDDFLEREFMYPRNGHTYRLMGKLMQWNKITAHVEYVTDITERKRAEQQNAALLKQLASVIEHVPGGMCLYRHDGKKTIPVVHNQAFYDIFGYSEDKLPRVNKETSFLNVHPNDIRKLKHLIAVALKKGERLRHTYRVYNDALKKYIWVYLNAVSIPQPDGTQLIYASYTDVTDERTAQTRLHDTQLLLSAALRNARITVWEYDIEKKQITQSVEAQDRQGFGCTIENIPESLIECGYIHPDCASDYRAFYREVAKGAPRAVMDVRVRSKDEKNYWWKRVIYIPVFDGSGKHLRSIGTAFDVTELKLQESQYAALETLKNVTKHGVMLNVTKNTADVRGAATDSDMDGGVTSIDKFFARTRLRVVDEKMRAGFDAIFSRENILQAYVSGKTEASYEGLCDFGDGRVRYTEFKLRLTRDPQTGDIIGFTYQNDIHASKTVQEMISGVIDLAYDYILAIRLEDDSFTAYASKSYYYEGFKRSGCYTAEQERWLHSCTATENWASLTSSLSLNNIKRMLDAEQTYSIYMEISDRKGFLRRKKLTFSYMDDRKEFILMTRADVTEQYNRQLKAHRELSMALEMAEGANTAKTEFLSKMSHDMRTPMNAVIGLAELARDASSLAECRDYLHQISTSGKYLLSIINDVLEMSRIESRDIELHPTIVYMPDFIRDTASIVLPDVTKKHISFEILQDDDAGLYMRVDTTYIQQVLVNLLSNAIKFTPEGGRIELIIENLQIKERRVTNRITVKDTGIGIGEEFLPKVFTPFEQENSTDDDGRMGTGLGLSIVKNIVERMGGVISVSSKKGEGTTFVVEWTLEAVSAEEYAPKEWHENCTHADIKGRRVLLCEDHPLNSAIAAKLLEKKGVLVEFAENGKIAVEKFTNRPAGYYDAILMDIRMPVMDGLEAAQAIRAQEKSDAPAVPIIAITANAFEEDRRKSIACGMNAHLAKPIEPQKLYETLARLLG